MKNNEHIKNLLEDFQVEDYDLYVGWKKLERKIHPRKKVIQWWKYTAAACVVLMALAYFLINDPGQRQSLTAFQHKEHLKLKKDSATEKEIVKANAVITANLSPKKYLTESSTTQSKQPVKNLKAESKIEYIEPLQKEVTNAEINPSKSYNQPVQNIEPKKPVKVITVLSEDEFAAMMNIEDPKQKKQNALTKYLASRARQLEYTGEKFSSQTTLIKF